MKAKDRLRTILRGAIATVVVGVLATAAWAAEGTGLAAPAVVRSPRMNINYDIDPRAAGNVARVEMWYARGEEGPWQLAGYDEDNVSPVQFVAPAEGLYRLMVVVVDRWGRRSCDEDGWVPTAANTIPADAPAHVAVMVDHTPPQLMLMSDRMAAADDSRQLRLRWAGFDTNLDTRPLYLFYQQGDGAKWRPIAQAQPAVGEFMWQVPETVGGEVVVKAVLADRAGNRDSQLTESIALGASTQRPGIDAPTMLPEVTVALAPNNTEEPFERATPALAARRNPPDNLRRTDRKQVAEQYFARAEAYRKQGEWAKASRAYEESLQYDPGRCEARVNLANSLYSLGELQQAQKHYEITLQTDPMRTTALFGLGHTYMGLGKHAEAELRFEQLVRSSPRDWQAWLGHGDAAAGLGKMDVARSSWTRAAKTDLKSIREQAYDRLANYEP